MKEIVSSGIITLIKKAAIVTKREGWKSRNAKLSEVKK
jgi:hypothetical protein